MVRRVVAALLLVLLALAVARPAVAQEPEARRQDDRSTVETGERDRESNTLGLVIGVGLFTGCIALASFTLRREARRKRAVAAS